MIEHFPQYFQDDSDAALRAQTRRLEDQLGVDSCFFAKFLQMDAVAFQAWRDERATLPSEQLTQLRELWQAMLHVFSFYNFDLQRVQRMLEYTPECTPESVAMPFAPPWLGSSLRTYLEAGGAEAIEEVDRWITAFRFGDPYTPATKDARWP